MNIMKFPKLPEDIERYLQKKTINRIAKCVAFELAIMFLLAFMGERLFSALGTVCQIIAYIALMVIPFIVTGVPLKLIDRSWQGEVTNVEVKTTAAFTKDVKAKQYTENSVWLTIKKSNGDIICEKAASFPLREKQYSHTQAFGEIKDIKPEHFLGKYNVGVKVFHFCGFEHLLIVDENNKSTTSCIVCGQDNDQSRKKCWWCGYSLIKF